MYKFNYVSSSNDGKMTAVVSSDFIADRLINRSIQSIATVDSGSRISFGLSDGGHVSFLLKRDTAEIIYYTASAK